MVPPPPQPSVVGLAVGQDSPAHFLELRGVLVVAGDRPAEPGKVARDCNRDDRAAHVALAVKPAPEVIQPLLGFPGDRDHRLLLAVLAARQNRAEPRRAAILSRCLDR